MLFIQLKPSVSVLSITFIGICVNYLSRAVKKKNKKNIFSFISGVVHHHNLTVFIFIQHFGIFGRISYKLFFCDEKRYKFALFSYFRLILKCDEIFAHQIKSDMGLWVAEGVWNTKKSWKAIERRKKRENWIFYSHFRSKFNEEKIPNVPK